MKTATAVLLALTVGLACARAPAPRPYRPPPADAQLVTFRAADGAELHGYFYLPAGRCGSRTVRSKRVRGDRLERDVDALRAAWSLGSERPSDAAAILAGRDEVGEHAAADRDSGENQQRPEAACQAAHAATSRAP
jgi:hypothetical protein